MKHAQKGGATWDAQSERAVRVNGHEPRVKRGSRNDTIPHRPQLRTRSDFTRRLYEDGRRTQPHLPKLAMKWFEDIVSRAPLADELWISKRRPREEDRYGTPDYLYHEDTPETPPLDEVYRFIALCSDIGPRALLGAWMLL